MNKFHVFLAMGAGLALTASAASADGYSGGLKDSVPYVADASWAGFYLGMHGGWGWKNDDFSTFVGTDITNQPRNIGGIELLKDRSGVARLDTIGNTATWSRAWS